MAFRNPVRSILAAGIIGLIQGSQLAADSIDGKTITGALIRTAAAGMRWQLNSTNFNQIDGFTGDPSEVGYGSLTMSADSAGLTTAMSSPTIGSGQPAGLAVTNLRAPAGDSLAVLLATTVQIQASDIRVFGPVNVMSEEWVYPALGNSWVTPGALGSAYRTVSYRKMADGTVMLRGVAGGGALGVMFTLPPGYRPLPIPPAVGAVEYFSCMCNGGAAQVTVDNAGNVNVHGYIAAGTNAIVSLSGVRFSYIN